MDQVILYEKSLQQRLQEYLDIFETDRTLPASRLEREWSFFLELSLDTTGWQAVWKVARPTCEALHIPFPTIVLVLVESVNFTELTAYARIFAVQDDIHLPEHHHIPLMALWPTKVQDNTVALNIDVTANCLDMFRFFYNHLFMPWDHDDDDVIDWKRNHLEPRLRLYYNMKNGTIPVQMAGHLHSLISEAKKIQVQRMELEVGLEDSDFDDSEQSTAISQKLAELHILMLEIKLEVEILENPFFRDVVIRRMQKSINTTGSPDVWVSLADGPVTDAFPFLTKVAELYPDGEKLKYSPLVGGLDHGKQQDVFLLSEGTHAIKTVGVLEHGGTLKGLGDPKNIVLTSQSKGIMLDLSGDTTLLDNLTIDGVSSQCVIVVRRGQLTLQNCIIIGDGKSSIHQGIIVMKGAQLVLSRCTIQRFCIAVVGNSGANVTVDNCEIYDCDYGLKIYEDTQFAAIKSTIRNCRKYGMCVEADHSPDETASHVGQFEILKIMPSLKIEELKGQNNGKADAVVNYTSKLVAFRDIFNLPEYEEEANSDEEMDAHNNTVIENVQV